MYFKEALHVSNNEEYASLAYIGLVRLNEREIKHITKDKFHSTTIFLPFIKTIFYQMVTSYSNNNHIARTCHSMALVSLLDDLVIALFFMSLTSSVD